MKLIALVALALLLAHAGSANGQVQAVRPPASGPTCDFEATSDSGHMHLAFFASPLYTVPVYLRLSFADGRQQYLFADGLHADDDGPHLQPGQKSAWVDVSGRLQEGRLAFRGACLFEQGQQVSGWAPMFYVSASAEPPRLAEMGVTRGVSQRKLLGERDPGRHLAAAVEPFQPWIEATAIMQPWSVERTRALVEQREQWIPRLKDMGFEAVIFIPGPGDIRPNYPTEVLRAAVDDYHAAGMKALMYWSIMHVGHHETWHTVGAQHPEWWQRDAEGNPVTVYGDKWLCPSTGALEFTADLGCRLAVELDADGVMLDNNEFFRTEVGPTGYCEGCQARFREQMRAELGDERLRAMGLAPEALRCPLPGEALYPWWIDWRYRAWREATETFRRRLREARPGTVLCANTQYRGGWYLAVLEQPQAEDLVFSESKGLPGVHMSNKLAYGRALADGKPVWNYLGTWLSSDMSRMVPPEGIYDCVCTTLAMGCSPWIVGYGLISDAPGAWWVPCYYQGADGETVSRDERGGLDGSTAVRLAADQVARMSVSHQPFLAVEPGQRFGLRCWHRTEDVAEGRPRARLTFVDARHKAPTGKPYEFFAEGEPGTHGWQELGLDEIVAPKGAEVLNVELFLWEGTGTVWFDDAELLRDGENLLRNPDFELAAEHVNAESREALARCLQFQRDHRDLYVGATPYVDVAVLASRHSCDFAEAYARYPSGTMSALAAAHIPFEVVTEQHLSPERLARYQVLVAPLASCLSDEHLGALADYALTGGNLLLTADTAMRDQFGRPRDRDLLAELLGRSREQLRRGQAVGAGRVRWLPEDPGRAYARSGLPTDAQLLADAVYELGGGALVAAEGCPPWLAIVPYAQPERRRLIIHLDNQQPGQSADDFAMGVALPRGWRQETARLYDLGGREAELPPAETPGLLGAVRAPVPEHYALVVVDCGG